MRAVNRRFDLASTTNVGTEAGSGEKVVMGVQLSGSKRGNERAAQWEQARYVGAKSKLVGWGQDG